MSHTKIGAEASPTPGLGRPDKGTITATPIPPVGSVVKQLLEVFSTVARTFDSDARRGHVIRWGTTDEVTS